MISSENFPVGLTKKIPGVQKKFWREKIDSIIAWYSNCCPNSSKNVSDFWQHFFRQVCQNHNLCLQTSSLTGNHTLRKLSIIVFGPWEKFRRGCKNCNLRVESNFLREIFSSKKGLVSWLSLNFESKVFELSAIYFYLDCGSCNLRVQGNF